MNRVKLSTQKLFIPSGGAQIYVQVEYPKKVPAPAIIVTHGLRSYFTGFLDTYAKRLRDAGYITVKFHFLGTGKSSGKFEEKTTAAMLQNYEDVLDFVEKLPNVTGIGLVGRSNAGSLATIHGPDSRVKAYAMMAPPTYFSRCMESFVKDAEVKDGFFYHKSYKRRHTKGEGRLPLSYLEETKKFDDILLRNVSKMKQVIFFQSTEDEAVPVSEGHFAYWEKHLPEPRKLVLMKGGNHSYKGHKKEVIEESVKWFKRFLPVS